MNQGPRPKPLAGVQVLDLTRHLPGPLCTQHLADMGADVIKIEDPREGDPARHIGQMEDGGVALIDLVNRNKRGLRLDLKQPKGVDIFKRLARRAAVIVEGFRPGVVDRLGIGYSAVRPLNAEIVYCSISGYGQTGAYRDRAGHDLNYCALSGIVDQVGRSGDSPGMLNFQIADIVGGTLSAAMGILAALLDARTSGQGHYIDVSMSDCALAHAVFPLAALAGSGAIPARGRGVLTGELPCYNLYESSDGRQMAVGALEKKFWVRLCQALERPDLEPYHMAVGDQGDWVKEQLGQTFRQHDQVHWTEHFEFIDCCVTPVLNLEEASQDRHFRQRGMFIGVEDGAAQVSGLAFPIRFDGVQFGVEKQAPAQGEHSAEILDEMGLSAKEIARLRQDLVI
jgi:crotonobetainyl-CoA:carnitine CoA-transferase CaiB-like acyl-CoA transferase